MENKETMVCSIMEEVREMRRKTSAEFGHDLNRLVAYYQELENEMKCHRLFRPKISKVKRRFVFENREVSDTLTPNVGVSGDTPV